ncbi:hypothetical protein ACOSQ4_003443 [Xanthoceras sorbifolium]
MYDKLLFTSPCRVVMLSASFRAKARRPCLDQPKMINRDNSRDCLPFGSPSSSVKTVLIESSITSPCSPFDLTDKRRLGCIWSCWCARIGLVIGVFRLVPILVENGGVGVSGSGGLELLWCSTLAL